MAEFDSRAYRDTMGHFATGVVIIAACEDDQLVGLAAQSFVSLSLDPPLIAVCPAKTSTSWPRIRSQSTFGINVLAEDQQSVSDAFAQKGQVADIDWQKSGNGVPIFEGVIATVECELDAEHEAGDHTIAVGRVIDFEVRRPGDRPLLFYRGGYGV